ncbi:hypothetical protein [Aquimarina mytili]|uniref:Uncharacterized protein n=1 Tax=Aquimarina mytili TaxID=874423 RepID=A0A937DCE8_9FLAO|nr:hypothetical protein [Aquimarina mytili]MBL0684866.1 hypothetical protein [Aquimarina mytili]
MKPEKFVRNISDSVINENLNVYKDLFETTAIDTVSDEYWKEALGLYNELDSFQKEVLFKIIRQTQVDSISNILGILDGRLYLEGQSSDFELTYDGKKLNNDLQDIFLEIDEESRE